MTLRARRLLMAFILTSHLFIEFVICEVTSCEPAEIGRDHEVRFKVHSNCSGEYPRIESFLGVIAKCPNYTLAPNINKTYNISLSSESIFFSTLTIRINNVSMDSGNSTNWFNLNSNDSTSGNCTVVVYLKAKALTCTSNITKVGLRIECLSSEMYPDGSCEFNTNLNGTFEKIEKTNVQSSNSPFITMMCTLSVPAANLTYGETIVTVTVYPRLNKKGTNSTRVVKLERPSVSVEKCQSTVKEGMNVTCHCQRTDSSDAPFDIWWYDNSTNREVGNGSISFIGKRNSSEKYFCQSKNIIEWTSEPVFYQPNILFPQNIKTFSVNGEVNKKILLNNLANISFFCEVDEADNQLTELSKDGTLLNTSSSNTIMWTITSASVDDTGVYQCSVSRFGEWTHDKFNVTVNVTRENDIYNQATKLDEPTEDLKLISIGAGGLVGMLFIVILFSKVIIESRMYTKKKCPNNKEVELDNSDIYNTSFENAQNKPTSEVKRNYVVDAIFENHDNYYNLAV